MSDFMTGLPCNYTSHPLYLQYLQQIMQQAQANQQAYIQNLQTMMQQQQAMQQQAAQQAQAAQNTTIQQTQTINPEQAAQQQVEALSSACEDGQDDGKISWKSKAINFAKGVGKFFTGMVCDDTGKFSLKRTLTSACVIAGGIVLTAATSGGALPYLVAAGATMGGLQLGKGTYKAITAKTDAEAAQAWQDIGGGTTAIIASTAGAKSALKGSGNAVPKGNWFTSSIKSLGECFRIAGKGTLSGLKAAVCHPMQSARAIGSYYQNNVKPNLMNMFSHKTAQKNFVESEREAIQNDINKIDNEITKLNAERTAELAKNPTSIKITEIDKQIAKLNNDKSIIQGREFFLDLRNKMVVDTEAKIAKIDAKLADPATSLSDKTLLQSQKDALTTALDKLDYRYKPTIKGQQSYIEEQIQTFKNLAENATGTTKEHYEQTIKNLETILKFQKQSGKIEIAQGNVDRATSQIKALQNQLKATGLTEAQKEAITAQIAKIEGAINTDKQILRNANMLIGFKKTLPVSTPATLTTYLTAMPTSPAASQLTDEEKYMLYQQLMAQQTAQQQSVSNPEQTVAQATGYNTQLAPQYNPNFAIQPPQGSGLTFNDLYVSPYGGMA